MANPNGSPDYTHCSISALALAKMCRHAADGGSTEVMGLVLGSTKGSEFIIEDAFALPVEATETRVNAMGEAYAYIVQYVDALKRSGTRSQVVGWYHSHPGYECFLSQIDINTQSQNQAYQDPFVALVVDPFKTARCERAEIGCFRTRENTFYALEVSYFTNRWDAPVLNMLDQRTWAKTLSREC